MDSYTSHPERPDDAKRYKRARLEPLARRTDGGPSPVGVEVGVEKDANPTAKLTAMTREISSLIVGIRVGSWHLTRRHRFQAPP